ncbi:MAG: hypothetical protein HYU67_03930 [Flavobacteriia bacterium]|nr:hypothetical protein [Flavobacteriia bacterium]
MNIEKYLIELVVKYEKTNSILDEAVINEIKKIILSFEKKKINPIIVFGSSIKKTNIKDAPKVKLLVSIKEKDKRKPEEILQLYFDYFTQFGENVSKSNNQIIFNYKGINFNILLAKKKANTYNFHVLNNLNLNKEIVTNFNIHTLNVVETKFQREIILMKLWREKHQLNFPTMYLELVVIKVLRKCKKKNLFSRILRILDFLRKELSMKNFTTLPILIILYQTI